LETLPDTIGNLENLEHFELGANQLKILPENISGLKNLKGLYLESNYYLTELPHEIIELEKLTYLNILYCRNIKITDLSVFLTAFKSLEEFDYEEVAYTAHYLYNASKNKCLRAAKLPETSLTYGPCDNSDNTIWFFVSPANSGNFYSKANPGYCLNIENGVVSLKKCNGGNGNIYRKGNFIKSKEYDNYCIGSSENDPNEISLRECNVNDSDQIWYFNFYNSTAVIEETPVNSQPETVTVYLYNALKNVCITSDGSSVTTGSCDFSRDNSLWEIPTSHNGYYRSKANAEQCLSIVDGDLLLSECNENTTLYRDGNFIKSPLSDTYCIGSSEGNTNELSIMECNGNDANQIWYFNNWDPSIVVEETPVNSQPETVTIYFYNALKNVCITSDGSSVTTGSCDFSSDYSLWEIPTSHNGYYRSKANAEQCLSIVDGVVSLGECNENATLYRDGLFIRSPLSEDYCIAASQFDSTLEYIEGCDMNDPDHIWYFNIYTPEASTTTTEEEPRMTISTIETEA
jgi:Leucine-rich repeat (LRR) protein